jgi:hypothetical protein
MELTTCKIAGGDAVRLLHEHRSRYSASGQYPFLIGDADDMELLMEVSEDNEDEPGAIIQRSLEISTRDWIARRRKDAEVDELSVDELTGEWPGEISEKGSVGLHKDVLTGKILPDVCLGLAAVEKPWHLPAILKYGGWNECPEPEVHCAFHRQWLDRYGAEITGMSGSVIECVVSKPPSDREAATVLAWEQYWYCSDIVEQGCESVANLAATLLNSPYWYFWWD